jgi:hypothetical protein
MIIIFKNQAFMNSYVIKDTKIKRKDMAVIQTKFNKMLFLKVVFQ